VPSRSGQIADWRATLVIAAALETGLLARFSASSRPDQAAADAGLDPRAARIVAGALRRFGVLEDAGDGALRLTARGRELTAPPGADSDPAGEIHLEARSVRSHLALADALRTGRAQDDVSSGDRAIRDRFMRAMRHIASETPVDKAIHSAII
jgi:hypothetical protein